MSKRKPSDLRNGNLIRFNGKIVKLEEIIHRTPGNLRAFYQTKMRNLSTNKIVEHRFRTDEDIELCDVETINYQILYSDENDFIVMDPETFEQYNVPISLFGYGSKYMKDNEMVSISFEEGEPILGEVPLTVILEITYTEPAIKGDTATNALKRATLETGGEIKVPLFVNIGDKVKVDTRTGNYLERAKS